MENYDVAINYLKKILDADKKRIDVWRALVFLYEKKENFNAAFSVFADAVKDNPDDVSLRMSMIAFFLKNDKDDMAMGVLSQLFPEINEKNTITVLIFIADYYEINVKIIEYLLHLVKKCPYRDIALLIMSVLSYRNGDMEQSRELLASAVAANPIVLQIVVKNNLLFLFEKVPNDAGIMLDLNNIKQQILLKNLVNQYFDE
jgi:tetratricopeptide (TPR) repeat protein